MTKRVWQCENCLTTYSEEREAENCEVYHRDASAFKIVSVSYQKLNGLYGPAYDQAQRVPQRIRVKFSDDQSDHATYLLEHYGPRAV